MHSETRPQTTLLVDWGDTVMRVLPDYSGPMHLWPSVEVVVGAAETLERLRSRARIALVTNALDSDERAVRRALGRAGLEPLFDHVFCARSLDSRKPSAEFFARALDRLEIRADQAYVIGDDLEVDINGARAAGLRAVWLNASNVALGTGCASATGWADVEAALDSLGFPAA